MSSRYDSGPKTNSRDTRDANDDKMIIALLTSIRDLMAGEANLASISEVASRDYRSQHQPSFSDPEMASAILGRIAPPAPPSSEGASIDPNPAGRPVDMPSAFGPEGPRLQDNYQKANPQADPAKPQGDGKGHRGPQDGRQQAMPQARDYTAKFDEIIKILGQMRGLSASAVALDQAAATADGSSSTSHTTSDGTGGVTTTTTRAPASPSYAATATGFGTPDFGYGTRAYPFTNVAGASEAISRNATGGIPGFQALAGSFSRSFSDFQSIRRPFQDFDPYAILKGDEALQGKISAARADLEDHKKNAPADDASDEEKAEHKDALKRKQSTLQAYEEHEKSRAESVNWAKSVTSQLSNSKLGPIISKLGAGSGEVGELAQAFGAARFAGLAGIAIAAPVAIAQFEKSVAQWASQGRDVGLQQVSSLGRYAMATPIAGDLAQFNVNRMMRDMGVGRDIAESSHRFLRYSMEVENRSRNADAADARMANQWATFRYSTFDAFNRIRDPFDELYRRATDNAFFDAGVKLLGENVTRSLFGPLTMISDALRALGIKGEEKAVVENPWLGYMKGFADSPFRMAPPLPFEPPKI